MFSINFHLNGTVSVAAPFKASPEIFDILEEFENFLRKNHHIVRVCKSRDSSGQIRSAKIIFKPRTG